MKRSLLRYLSIQKWLTISFHLQMTLGASPAKVYAKNENKVHYLWPSLSVSLACVRKVELLGNTLPPPGLLASLKVVLIFVNNLWFICLISCQQTKSFYNVHSFRLCVSWWFEGFLPLFGVVPFSFYWCWKIVGTARPARSRALLPGCTAGVSQWTAQLIPVFVFKLGGNDTLPGPAELLCFPKPFWWHALSDCLVAIWLTVMVAQGASEYQLMVSKTQLKLWSTWA